MPLIYKQLVTAVTIDNRISKDTINIDIKRQLCTKWHTQSFYDSSGFCPRLHRWASTRKLKLGGKSNLDLLEQETVSGSGICWAICKPAPHPRKITMPTSHNSVFYRPDALPASQPTASKQLRHVLNGMIVSGSSEQRSYFAACTPVGLKKYTHID